MHNDARPETDRPKLLDEKVLDFRAGAAGADNEILVADVIPSKPLPIQLNSFCPALRRCCIDIGCIAPPSSHSTGTCCRDEKRTKWKGIGCLRLIL